MLEKTRPTRAVSETCGFVAPTDGSMRSLACCDPLPRRSASLRREGRRETFSPGTPTEASFTCLGGSRMKIHIELEVGPSEVGMATELLAVLRCARNTLHLADRLPESAAAGHAPG